MRDPIDIGHGLSIVFTDATGSFCDEAKCWEDYDAGRPCGIILQRGEQLIGGAHFRGSGPCWTVESKSPLTISPSLLCQPANIHGFIRAGRWVPA